MKLRIRGNSIRLRLGESEVARLATDGQVEESTQFTAAGDRLTYAVLASNTAGQISAELHDQTISIHLPKAVCRRWAASSEVTLKAEQSVGDGSALTIVVEKDFKCLEPRVEEDESDAFPNPAGRACDPD